MQIGLIAVDMDGTLLDIERKISLENAKALRAAEQAGIKVAICSGRAPEDIDHYAADAGLGCWVCAINGCCVVDAPYGNVVEEHFMRPESALACIDFSVAHGLMVYATVPKGLVVLRNPPNWVFEEWEAEQHRRGREWLNVGESALREAAVRGVYKFMAVDEADDGKLVALSDLARRIPGVEVTSSWPDNIELMPAGIHKGTALAALANRLGVARERVMAIGDQTNDREMLAWAGYGVAMGNATPEIQEICRYHTNDNAHDGVAEAVRRWALGEKL